MNTTTKTAQIGLTRSSPAFWRVTFDNPPLNLMGPEFVLEFREIMTALETDEQVKVVVFDSAVEGFFLNHSDFLARLEDLTGIPQGPTGLEAWPDILVRLTRAPIVTIASIRGRATGNGSEIALACDMSFASREKAVLSQWEVGVGLVAGGGPMARLPRLMGRGRALEVLLGSDDIRGDLAQAYGYVNRSLPDDELDGFVDAIATRIASFDKWAIANTKRLVNAASLPPDVEIKAGWDACMASLGRPAAQGRVKALFEQGFHTPGDAEDRLGYYLGRSAAEHSRARTRQIRGFGFRALPLRKDTNHGFTRHREEYRRPRRGTGAASKVSGRRLPYRHSRKRRPQTPHERSADLLDRALRAESLYVGASWHANGRPPSARAARAVAFPADVPD